MLSGVKWCGGGDVGCTGGRSVAVGDDGGKCSG